MRWIMLCGLLCCLTYHLLVPGESAANKPQANKLQADTSLAIAERLLDQFSAEQLESRLSERPALAPGLVGTLGTALAKADGDLASRLETFWKALTRARSRRLSARPEGITQDDADQLLTLQLVDLRRFVDQPKFRQRVFGILPGALDADASPQLRQRLLYSLHHIPGVDFDAFEEVAAAWGAVPRKSSQRQLTSHQLTSQAGLVLGNTEAPIIASVYSLPAAFFTAADALTFLAAVRAASARRTIVVLTSGAMHDSLATSGRDLDLRLVETWGFPFTPWPRDPLTFLRAKDGRRVAILRPPNQRQGRPEDSWIGRALVQGLPVDLDRSWKLHWRRSNFPFHNGQVLTTGERLWVTLHSLEFRILEILGLERVPVEHFAGPLGQRYVEAARQAAAEFGELYGRKVTFVHPMPASDAEPKAVASALLRLGGGAGFDLDSLATVLAKPDGKRTALVADPKAALRLVEQVSRAELDRFAAAYGLAPKGEQLRKHLAAAQQSPRAKNLTAFLDLVADHLEAKTKVRRLPLLLVPRTLQKDRGGMNDSDFLVGWNNVVLELSGDSARAEGFASLLESGDELARRVFAEEGYRLDLLPSLVESVVLNGGYRCASQHIR